MTQKKRNFYKEIVEYARQHYNFAHVVFDEEEENIGFYVNLSAFFSLDWKNLEPVYKCYSEKNIRTIIENGWANMIRKRAERGIFEYTTGFCGEDD